MSENALNYMFWVVTWIGIIGGSIVLITIGFDKLDSCSMARYRREPIKEYRTQWVLGVVLITVAAILGVFVLANGIAWVASLDDCSEDEVQVGKDCVLRSDIEEELD